MPDSNLPAPNNPEAFLGDLTASSIEPSTRTSHQTLAQPTRDFDDFALFIDSMTIPYTDGIAAAFVGQPLLPFSPSPLFGPQMPQCSYAQWQNPSVVSRDMTATHTSAPYLLDEFSSTFPSFESCPSEKFRQEPWRLTQQDWGHLTAEIQLFTSVLPADFFPPSRHTMARYIATYFSGFHRHLPFLHLPTFSYAQYPVDLILAMAAIGAQSSFDHDNAVMFFRTSQAIVTERLRCHKAEQCRRTFSAEHGLPTDSQAPNPRWLRDSSSVQELPPGMSANGHSTSQFGALSAAKTLLLLMAIATWANSKAIYNEAIGLQNTLSSLVREERFLEAQTQTPENITWHKWINIEGFKRTATIIFCFFIFHTIVYDTPPPILNCELDIYLPSREKDWAAASEKDWQAARKESEPESAFQSSFSYLFSKQRGDSNETPKGHSSLGGYALILALIQHIYFLRKTSKCKAPPEQGIAPTDVAAVEQALRNWQNGWYMDPESSFSPGSPQGPISFNSTALLRMAYIRLTVDVGPWRSLNTHDPHGIAQSIHQSPDLEPSHKLTRAVLYSAHALSIPVKIGVNIVARSQAFIWSLQHALCALECAFVISKWLIAMHYRSPDAPLDEDESRLLAYIVDMVAEADPGFYFESNRGVAPHIPDLCSRVIKIWAKLLSGEAVWDVVRMIGKVLEVYGQMLERQAAA
ncbi:fungal specific transcription factor domain-containing protein [Aspergillus lucknowensis]|uniref:Xylanolytic transcriptional activator regulatory domain-containing protein n=1 Tax=Aspergillus lucknowensis TaxID=176173 RepID=A0ABR4M4G4_9EURO